MKIAVVNRKSLGSGFHCRGCGAGPMEPMEPRLCDTCVTSPTIRLIAAVERVADEIAANGSVLGDIAAELDMHEYERDTSEDH